MFEIYLSGMIFVVIMIIEKIDPDSPLFKRSKPFMPETNLTRLVLANKSKSLRTIILAHIIRQFELEKGDQLEWSL